MTRISQQECRGILESVLCFICTEKNELFMKILKRKGKKDIFMISLSAQQEIAQIPAVQDGRL